MPIRPEAPSTEAVQQYPLQQRQNQAYQVCASTDVRSDHLQAGQGHASASCQETYYVPLISLISPDILYTVHSEGAVLVCPALRSRR